LSTLGLHQLKKSDPDAVAGNPDHLPRLFVVPNNLLQDAGCGEQSQCDDLNWIHGIPFG